MSVLFKDLANAIRFLSIDAVQKANSGHPGLPMGMADVATVLFKYYLRFSPKNPSWVNRDNFNQKIDELNQETETLIDEIEKWQM